MFGTRQDLPAIPSLGLLNRDISPGWGVNRLQMQFPRVLCPMPHVPPHACEGQPTLTPPIGRFTVGPSVVSPIQRGLQMVSMPNS